MQALEGLPAGAVTLDEAKVRGWAAQLEEHIQEHMQVSTSGTAEPTVPAPASSRKRRSSRSKAARPDIESIGPCSNVAAVGKDSYESSSDAATEERLYVQRRAHRLTVDTAREIPSRVARSPYAAPRAQTRGLLTQPRQCTCTPHQSTRRSWRCPSSAVYRRWATNETMAMQVGTAEVITNERQGD
jgi:hypothetical protein